MKHKASFYEKYIKRGLDILLSGGALIVLSPVLLVTAILVRTKLGSPVIFCQERPGKDEKIFVLRKFRTMTDARDEEGNLLPDEERLTSFGKMLRATSLDELPELINIIKGDMSIVGPRPERVEHMEKYGAEIPEFAFRTKVKGGLTGFAQIYGKYNTSPYDKLRLDMMYIENYSFIMDIKLILMTVRIMLKKDSTEGFDKAEELERMTQEVLSEIHKEEDPVAPGK